MTDNVTEIKRKRGGGPKTPEGKRNSSLNSTRHGSCSSRTILLPGESEAELNEVWIAWLGRYNPTTHDQHEMVRQAVFANWRMQRAECNLDNFQHELYSEEPNPSRWTAEQHKNLQNFERYLTTHTNRFHKSLRIIEFLAKADAQVDREDAKIVEELVSHHQDPEVVRNARDYLASVVHQAVEISTDRTDGGCRCPGCAHKWGIAEHLKKEDSQEESNIPEGRA